MRALHRPTHVFPATYEPVLGTVLQTRIAARRKLQARKSERTLLTIFDELENQLSVFRPNSNLARWRKDAAVELSEPLRMVLDLSQQWQHIGGNSFNPASGFLSARWKRAEIEQQLPDVEELLMLARSLEAPRYVVEGNTARHLASCELLTFHAIAKGLVIDLAAAATLSRHETNSLLINLGGDLLHRGTESVVVGVEHPQRPYDNVEPFDRVRISNQAMATSGATKRGFRICDRWYSHIIDPRTGWPVENVLSASVIASDAMTADIVATVASVLDPTASFALIDALTSPVGVLVVTGDGVTHSNAYWDEHREQRRARV